MDIDEKELEQEQLDYIRRMQGDISVPDLTDNFPDKTRTKESVVVLDKEQEKKIISDIRAKIPFITKEDVKPRNQFTISGFLNVISSSFVGIMDDLLNFDGNIDELNVIFTKDDRMVFIGTIIIIVSILLLSR